MLPAFWSAAALASELGEGDVMIVVGASGAVAPACHLPYAAMSHGCHVIEVNLERCLEDEVPVDGGDGGRPVMLYGPLVDLARQQSFLRGRAGSVLPAGTSVPASSLQLWPRRRSLGALGLRWRHRRRGRPRRCAWRPPCRGRACGRPSARAR